MTDTDAALRDFTVFLSAAFPDQLKGKQLAQALLTFQARIVRGVVRSGGRVIFGGHPSVMRVIHRSTEDATNEVSGVDLFQLERFRQPDDPIVQDRTVFRSVTWIPRLAAGDATVGAELTIMRQLMVGPAQAAVFAGGRQQSFLGSKPGIREEYELFVGAHPKAPAYLVGLFGGAAADLIGELRPSSASRLIGRLGGEIQDLNVSHGDSSVFLAGEDPVYLAGKILASLRRLAAPSAEQALWENTRAHKSLESFAPSVDAATVERAVCRVRITYATGIKRPLFTSVRLAGNWDSAGNPSAQSSIVAMTRIDDFSDGCPAYQMDVVFPVDLVGHHFHFGVLVDDAQGRSSWGLPTEVHDPQSTDRWRSFVLEPPNHDGAPQQVDYLLNRSRQLGAQPYYRPEQAEPAIRFGVWAPNALEVQVVFGSLWDNADLKRAPTDESLPVQRIAGGYIADDGTGAHPTRGPFLMSREGDEWFTDVNDPALARFAAFDHKPYMFRVRRDDGAWVYRTDLYSRCQIGKGKRDPRGAPFFGLISDLDASSSCSVVVDPDRVTEDFQEPVWPEKHFVPASEFWQHEFDPARPVPRLVADLIIYELHVGALGGPGKAGPGDFGDAIKLLDYLVALGVNAVELLPISEFGAGNEAWGYGSSHYFAVESRAGGRDQFKWFVRECHRRGVAVIVDVVYNHYSGSSERAQWAYDSPAPERNIYFWYEGRASDYPAFDAKTPPDNEGQGGYVENFTAGWAPRFHEEMVRGMFVSSAVALIEEFHLDGFRVDLIDALHGLNRLHADGAPVPAANLYGIKFLREWSRTLKLIKPGVVLIAEDYSGWSKVTEPAEVNEPTETGGLGFDAVWYQTFYEHLVGNPNKGPEYAKLLLTAALDDDRALAIDYFAGALSSSSGKVVYHLSHDTAGNIAGTRRTIEAAVNGAALIGATRRRAEARARLVAGLALLSAGTPMFFMGEEVGASKPFTYNRWLENREDLYGERAGDGARMFRFYQEAIRLRLNHAGLRSRRIDVLYVNNINRILAFRRWAEGSDYLVLASFNNLPFGAGYVFPNLRLTDDRYEEIFNSDAATYGGDNVGNAGATISLRNGRFEAVVPANAFVVFERRG